MRLFKPRTRIADDVWEELRFHIEGRIAELVDAGWSEADANAEVLRRFGDIERFGAECQALDHQRIEREAWRMTMDAWMQDLRLAVRSISKNRGFTAVVVLTLAVGIGATTAIFSVVNGVLLAPLPFDEPDRIAMVWENDRNTRTLREAASVPDYFDFIERNRTFDEIALYANNAASLTRPEGDPIRVSQSYVTHNLDEVLGVRPRLGRGIEAAEDEPGGDLVAVLSDRFWTSAYGADPDVLGRIVVLDDLPYTIVGVLPAGLHFPSPETDIWTPIQVTPTSNPRSNHWVNMIGRMGTGVSVQRAQDDMVAIAAELEAEYQENSARGAFVEPIADVMRGGIRDTLLVLFAAVLVVLAISCANVANLLLARGAARAREVAVLSALGASSSRLARKFLVEGVVLTGVSAILGVLLAVVGVKALVSLAPGGVTGLDQVGIDAPVLAFSLVVSGAIGLGFGLLPSIQASRLDIQTTLKEGRAQAGTGGRNKNRARKLLVTAQMGMAVVLLVSTGLLISTVANLQRVDKGFDEVGVLRMDFRLPASRYPRDFSVWPDWPETAGFVSAVQERVAAVPGVDAMALTTNHPMDAGFTNSFGVEGRPRDPDQGELTTRLVSPGYFETVGLHLVEGRLIGTADRLDSNPVLLLNEAAVRRYFPDGDAIGQRVAFWGRTYREVIGIVEDEKMHGLDQPAPPAMYASLLQLLPSGSQTLMVRTSGDPEALIGSVRRAVWDVDRDLALYNISTMEETVAQSVGQQRFTSILLALFAGVAVMLATVGVHGVLSYLVTQRGPEMGIRMALGATRAEVMQLVVSQGVGMAGLGIVLGLVGALGASRLLTGLLFGVETTDPLTYGAVAVVLGLAALAACLLPARRATGIDPVEALRAQ